MYFPVFSIQMQLQLKKDIDGMSRPQPPVPFLDRFVLIRGTLDLKSVQADFGQEASYTLDCSAAIYRGTLRQTTIHTHIRSRHIRRKRWVGFLTRSLSCSAWSRSPFRSCVVKHSEPSFVSDVMSRDQRELTSRLGLRVCVCVCRAEKVT